MKKQKNNQSLTLAIAFALGCCIFSTSNAFAEEVNAKAELAFDLEGITVEAARPDWESKLSPGSVTVINPDDYKGEQKTLPDLMRKVPGVHVREVNGKGQYSTVTVRGSTAAQVGVFIDGVLSNLGGDSAVDLSTIPVANVERIEVYRGYIPARFAGTYIGGVINIVTKKPERANVDVELGTSSYGGKKGALEITAPLGSGSLMFGTNYESSDGDFKYENYAANSAILDNINDINSAQEEINKFTNKRIGDYADELGLSSEQQESFRNNNDSWIEYVKDTGSDGFAKAYQSYLENASYSPSLITLKEFGLDRAGWNSLNDQEKSPYYQKIAENTAASVNPELSKDLEKQRETLAISKQKLAEAQNAKRWRQYNDYENINSILKWQNENWMVKAAWNKVDRHLPDSLWNGEPANALHSYNIDLYDTYFYSSRRQEIDTKELMIQNRQNVGKLEWGWFVDYTKSDKSYRAENIMDNNTTNYEDQNGVLRRWSRYESDKYNAQIDGTYKVSDNNMLDFQVNFSHEKLNVDGHNMDKVLKDEYVVNSTLGQIRNRYDQDMLNIQVQDTITLDNKDSWYLTPSVKYNRSTITGFSDGSRFGDRRYEWVTPKDEQTDDKVTWQVALKKEFDSNFTMRMTGGTYYRLLNMYEIAGDGAGVLPAPNNNGRDTSFPLPEEGKQFDISALWNGKALGAFNKTTLTYFWRDSDNMLQLQRFGKDYWSYMNDKKGTANGIELQTSFNWNKFDLDIQATYIKSDVQQKNSTNWGGYDYIDVYATYQPEWEGNVRLTYRPHEDVSIFAEGHYTDMYYTNDGKKEEGSEVTYLQGRPVDELLVFNTGMKVNLKNNWQLSLGCNDVFNKGPKQKIYYGEGCYLNPEFPVQGRTYYATVKCSF